MKQFIILMMSCLLGISLSAGASRADIITGKFGKAQVFDVHRSPLFPKPNQSTRLYQFKTPYADTAGGRVEYTMQCGQYIQFFYTGGVCTGDNVGIKLYNSDGSLDESTFPGGIIQAGGSVYGLSNTGFLHNSVGDTGTFVTNNAGYNHDDELTYTPLTGDPATGKNNCAELTSFAPNTDPMCVASATPSMGKMDYKRARRIVKNFMARRGDQITANEPELIERLQNKNRTYTGDQPVNFIANGASGRYTASFSTSLAQIAATSENNAEKRQAVADVMALGQRTLGSSRLPDTGTGFDIWAQGKFVHVNGDDQDMDLGLLYLGTEYSFSPNFKLGVIGQLDWSNEDGDKGDVSISGTGWMVGPYVIARLHDHLIFDGRVAAGQSKNQLNPVGNYSDSFDSTRWLIHGRLSGQFNRGDWTLSPQASLIYFEDAQKAYTDGQGVRIAGQTTSVGQLTFGPKLQYHSKAHDGTLISSHLGVKGIWSFDQSDIVNIDTGVTGGSSSDLRARVKSGITATLTNGWSLAGESFYDGIGDNHFEAYGGSVSLMVPLN